jgi:quinoprotein glucose dehydrogenase
VAQGTKSGWLLLFDRETGAALYPIEERVVSRSDVDGEQLARAQPFATHPAPFLRQQLTENMLTRRTPEAHAAVLKRFKEVRSGPQFTPPSLEGTVVFPGFDDGAEWGGQAFDPETGLYYVNSNEMPWILRLVPRNV